MGKLYIGQTLIDNSEVEVATTVQYLTSTEYYALETKDDTTLYVLTDVQSDTTPTSGSTNLITSGGVYSGISEHNIATDAHAALFGSKQNDIGFSVDANGIITRIIGGVTEYVNPPMIAGTEYRTTERFAGLPVYAKMISCGALPNAGRKDVVHGITNLKQFVSCYGTTLYAQGILTMPYFGGTTGEYTASAHKTSIVLLTTIDATSFTETYITLKYTKTTD